VLEAVTKVRTRAKAWRKVYGLLDDRIADADRFHLTVINAGASEEAARFKEGLLARFSPVEVMETELSPAIGAHTGPGTVGVVYYVE
jgi:fatty acid-binding protein DegV